jgi:hypothetical protein
MHNCRNLLPGDSEHRQLARQVGGFARFVAFIRLWMTSQGIDWTPGARVCFRRLDFIFTMGES